MKRNLQNVIFPTEETLQQHWDLFYTGPRCVQDGPDGALRLPAGLVVGFASRWKAGSGTPR